MLHHRVVAKVFLLVAFVVAVGAWWPPAAAQEQETTIAGCLQASTNPGGFVLVADDKQTYQVQAAENVELAPHANHRVEVTGTVEKSEDNNVLKATALKMVESSCEA
jgi:hypothetical protein